MARRNVVRSVRAALVVAVSVAAGVPGAMSPAAAADEHVVTVRDDGFTQTTVNARVDDFLVFRLDDGAIREHTLAWERGELEFRFSRRSERTWVRYGPLKEGTLHFYDSSQLDGRGPHPPGPFSGILTVSQAPPPPPSSSTTSSTTTTLPPTTTTTAPGSIRPFLIPEPQPTSTTTTAPLTPPPPNGEAPAPPAGQDPADKQKDGPKDKGKSKAAARPTPTTAAPAPSEARPPDLIFDPASLTPGPITLPAPAGSGSGDQAALDAAAAADLLNPDTDERDGGGRAMVSVFGALAVVFVLGAVWRWQHRSSRYFPA